MLLSVTKAGKSIKHLLGIFHREKEGRGGKKRAVGTQANPIKILEGHLGTHGRETEQAGHGEMDVEPSRKQRTRS